MKAPPGTRTSSLGILFRTEFRMVLRDRRVLLTAILLPVLVMPLMIAGSHWTLQKRQARLNQAVYRYSVVGDDSDVVRGIFQQASQSQSTPAVQNSNSPA